MQKKLLGVFSQVKIGLKKTSRQKNLATLVALDFTLVSETLGRSFKLARLRGLRACYKWRNETFWENSKKMDSKSEK